MNYNPARGVRWAVEEDGILIVDQREKKSLKLNQTESALWQLNMVRTPYSQLSLFLSLVKGIPIIEADRFIEELFELWRKQRFLTDR